MLTAETITHDQIRTLRAEARTAGDSLQVVICDIALSGEAGLVDDGASLDDYEPDTRDALYKLGLDPAKVNADVKACGLCAEAINEARAQEVG